MPGTDQALNAAAQHGYEAATLVAILFGVFGLLGYIVKVWIAKASDREDKVLAQAIDRENTLTDRVNDLEKFIREQLLEQLKESTKSHLTVSVAMGEVCQKMSGLDGSLHTTRTCFWSDEQQKRVVERVADNLCESLIALVATKITGAQT